MKLTKKQKVITITTISLAAITIWIIVKHATNKRKIQLINDILDGKEKDPTTGVGQKIITQSDLSKLPVGNFPLKIGDKNQKVAALQQALNRKYGTSIDIDGKLGQGTYDIVASKYFDYSVVPTTTYPFYKHRDISSADFDNINT